MRRIYLAVALLLALPVSGRAQSPDFLFGRPHGTLAVRTGWNVARASSDLYTFVENQLTVNKKNFNAPSVGLDLNLSVTPRVSAVLGYDFSGSTTSSEYRHMVDNNRLPIQQTTALRQYTISGSVKFALTPRGRAISQHAWIPSVFTPYVGLGGGLVHYDFTQHGDFVDFTDGSVFNTTLDANSWGPSAQVFGGVDVKATRRLYVNAEGRYVLAHAPLTTPCTGDRASCNGNDFSGFKPIDLAGFKMTGGVRYMF